MLGFRRHRSRLSRRRGAWWPTSVTCDTWPGTCRHMQVSIYRNVEHIIPTPAGPNHINICCHTCWSGIPHFHISNCVGIVLPHTFRQHFRTHFPTFVSTFVAYFANVDQQMFPHLLESASTHEINICGSRLPHFCICLNARAQARDQEEESKRVKVCFSQCSVVLGPPIAVALPRRGGEINFSQRLAADKSRCVQVLQAHSVDRHI
jgi:hypothetical protein